MLKWSSSFPSSLMSRMKTHNFVFSWVWSSHVICVISVIWIQSVLTSMLFCYRHQYSVFVRSMWFVSDILLIYHHVWVLKKLEYFRHFSFIEFHIVRFGLYSDRWPFCWCRNQMQWGRGGWRVSQNHHLLTHWLSKIYCCSYGTF